MSKEAVEPCDAEVLLKQLDRVLDEALELRKCLKGFHAVRRITSFDVDNMSLTDLVKHVNIIRAVRS